MNSTKKAYIKTLGKGANHLPLQGIDMDLDDLTPEEMELLGQIKDRKRVLVAAHRRRKSAANNHSVMPRGRDVERNINTDQMKVRARYRS